MWRENFSQLIGKISSLTFECKRFTLTKFYVAMNIVPSTAQEQLIDYINLKQRLRKDWTHNDMI